MREIDLPYDSFIGGWFFENTTVCDRIIEFFDDNPQLTFEGRTTDGVVESIKKSTDLSLTNAPNILQNLYHSELQKVCLSYIRRYEWCARFSSWSIIDAVNLQKYNPGGGYYAWHTERVSGVPPVGTRCLVFLTYLNDVECEGETEFFYQKIKVKPQKGLTLIWPSDWTHVHRGIPSPKETKYVATGWYNFV